MSKIENFIFGGGGEGATLQPAQFVFVACIPGHGSQYFGGGDDGSLHYEFLIVFLKAVPQITVFGTINSKNSPPPPSQFNIDPGLYARTRGGGGCGLDFL